MRFIALLIAALLIAAVSSQAVSNGLLIDTYTDPVEFDFMQSEVVVTNRDGSFIGGRRGIYASRTEDTDPTGEGDLQFRLQAGFLEYSIGASIGTEFITIYKGAGADLSSNPCGGNNWLNETCDVSTLINSPGAGLGLSLSGFSGIGFTVEFQDNPATFGVRLLFNDNQSGYASITLSDRVSSSDPKPVIFFPLSAFGTEASRASGLRAVLIGIQSNEVALDVVISPPQFSGVDADKTADRDVATVGDDVQYTISVAASRFQVENLVIGTAQAFNSEVTIVDNLPAGFTISSNPVLTMSSGFSTVITPTTNNRFEATFDLRNGANANITYTATISGVSAQCNPLLCNNADISVTTTSDAIGDFVSQFGNQAPLNARPDGNRVFNVSRCTTIASEPIITVRSNVCPTASGPSTAQYELCNGGSTVATGIVMSQDLSAGCTITAVNNVDCNGNTCNFIVPDIGVNQCVTQTVSYQCTPQNICQPQNFAINATFFEPCSDVTLPVFCVFTEALQTELVITEVARDSVTFFRPGEVVIFDIQYSRNGIATPTNALVTKVYGANVQPTAATINAGWVCLLDQRSCTIMVTPTTTPQALVFSVTIDTDFPVNLDETCNAVTITNINPPVQTCSASDNAAACANVNPGTPNVVIAKSVFASQYRFMVTYSSKGTTGATNVVLHEILQRGWSLSEESQLLGWVCQSKQCRFDVGIVAIGQTGAVPFVVDILPEDRATQQDNNKCWENIVTATFDNSEFDPVPDDNCASAQIGSSCQECCEITCPPTQQTVVADCPTKTTCRFDVPQYYCPPCQVEPAACTCPASCSAVST